MMSHTRTNVAVAIANTTSTIIKSLMLPAFVATTTYFCQEGVKASPDYPVADSVRVEAAKEFMYMNSAINTFAIAYSASELIGALIKDGGKLNGSQLFAVLAACVPAMGGVYISMSNWVTGEPEAVNISGYSAAGSAAIFNAAKEMTTFFANKNIHALEDHFEGRLQFGVRPA